MITADQIAAHLVGDYILQSNWMATEKTKSSVAAAAHAASYTVPFALITSNIYALMIISITHFVIDKLCCEQSFSTTELARVLALACVAIGKAEGRT